MNTSIETHLSLRKGGKGDVESKLTDAGNEKENV
jgi:hypothetical protein